MCKVCGCSVEAKSTGIGALAGPPQEEIYRRSLELARRTRKGVIPYMEDEVERFEEAVAKFRAGEVDEANFMRFRLRQGVYGQRQPNRQMFRVKIPGGILTPEALEVLGEVAERFAPLKKGHLTTRENMQFHHILLEDAPEIMRILGTAGLTSREACGNTVRNVVGPPLAGVCPDELFDPTPYLVAYVRFGVRHPITQDFPRKFKTSFSGCPGHDAVASLIHDLSFVAQVRQEKGALRRGFKVYVGGATSIMPRLAKPLYDFVPEEDYLRVALAVWTVFNKADMLRKNRMMARIKVLIERIGIDAFRGLVDEELRQIGPIDPTPLMDVEELYQEAPPLSPPGGHRGADNPDFLAWRQGNTLEQRQKGYFVAFIKVPLGDIYAHQFPVLANVVRWYTGGRARVTQEQNLALRWVPEGRLYDVWKALKDIGLAEPGVNSITDVVACPATDSCKLGITSAMGVAKALREAFASSNGLLEDPLIQKMRIKISGCPNGCAQHHIASIGLHGAAMKGPGGEQIPAYELFVGGEYGGADIEATRFGQRLPGVKIPAKRVPEFVRALLAFYKEHRRDGEGFPQFVARLGPKPLEALASEFKDIPPLGSETIGFYMDWARTTLFKVERGEGECSV
ncbi:MAG: nitrite/sulfite reductase [Dehalococcoidia bacterium]